MSNFAWIGYYPEREFFLKISKTLGLIKEPVKLEKVDDLILKLGPQELLYLDNVRSKTGAKAKGSIIMAPLLLKQIALLDRETLNNKILSSVKLALQRKAKIVCLAGALGDFVPEVKTKIKEKVFFVTGRKFLVATIINNILKLAKDTNADLAKTKIAIFDISSPIGRVCAQILSKKVKEICFFDQEKRKIEDFKELNNISSKKVKISNSIDEVLDGSKFIISTSLFMPQEAIEKMASGSVIFDTIVPFWVAKTISKQRKDVLPIEVAWTTRGPLIDKRFDIVFPKDAIYCCIAEVTMLGLENEIKDSFLKLIPKNVAKINRISKKHNFNLAGFRNNGHLYSNPTLKKAF